MTRGFKLDRLSGIYYENARSEYIKQTSGEKSIHWKGGLERYPKCLECGVTLSNLSYKRCVKHNKIKELHPKWKGGNETLPQCLDCGKRLSRRRYTRCKSCKMKGDLNPMRRINVKDNNTVG